MILWALEGTDPAEDQLLTRAEIERKIFDEIPAATQILKGAIPPRLRFLSEGLRRGVRPVRAYKKQGKYCLSHDIRKQVAQDNTDDEAIRIEVARSLNERAEAEAPSTFNADQIATVVDVALRSVHKTFEQEGLEFSAFLIGELREAHNGTISDHVDECLDDETFAASDRILAKELALSVLRGAFYESREEERLYFSRLSATYTLLFCLNSEPKVVEYFQSMSSDFYLYVGTDILVRALSERYLHQEDQMTRNTLRLIKEAGGTLVLTDPVLDEIYSHVAATDHEYNNHYRRSEHIISEIISRNSDRILIRAYFYAKQSPAEGIVPPQSWNEFIHQFCDYASLHSKQEGREQLRRYLMAEFGLNFEHRSELEALSDQDEVSTLAELLLAEKSDPRLAKNDALMALSIYGRRRELKETTRVSEFGYRTWWLTSESTIRRHTKELVEKNGARYIMRPEFLLNFLTLAPSTAEVKKTFKAIFPSLLGLRLGRRVETSQIRGVLRKLAEAEGLDDGRRQARVSQISDKLKSDFYRRYQHEF